MHRKVQAGDAMHIVKLELQKLVKAPVIWVLLAVFFLFNCFYIWSNQRDEAELAILTSIIEMYGIEINDEVLAKLSKDIQKKVESLDSELEATAFLETITSEYYYEQPVKTQQQIDELSLYVMYENLAKSLPERYASIEIEGIANEKISQYQFTGLARSLLDAHYKDLAERVDVINENQSYNSWYFAGEPYRMHSFLHRDVLKMIALEGILLTVLLTAYLTCFEKEQRTQLLVFSSKVGRTVMKFKVIASLLMTLLLGGFLLIGTLLIFFKLHDYEGLWQASIGSGLNWDYKTPYIFWWDMPVWVHLILVIAVIVSTWLIISTFTFAFATFLQNSYIVSIVVLLSLVALFVVPSYLTFSPNLFLASYFNITLLFLNPHMLFNGLAGFLGFKYIEVITILTTACMALIAVIFAIKCVLRKDIHL